MNFDNFRSHDNFKSILMILCTHETVNVFKRGKFRQIYSAIIIQIMLCKGNKDSLIRITV